MVVVYRQEKRGSVQVPSTDATCTTKERRQGSKAITRSMHQLLFQRVSGIQVMKSHTIY